MTDKREEIVRRKGGALKSDRGLQIWENDLVPEEPGQAGDASQGTAERQAKIGKLAKRDP